LSDFPRSARLVEEDVLDAVQVVVRRGGDGEKEKREIHRSRVTPPPVGHLRAI
jgi:CO dehydrogenase/acetyl-CoA synthase delta subunit